MNNSRPQGSLISHFSRLARQAGGINLAQGRPGFSPPRELLQLLARIAADPEVHQYAPGNGDSRLLDLLMRKLSAVTPLHQDNILIVQGATEAIFQAFFYLTRILAPPFSVLSFDPVYESYSRLAQIFSLPFIFFPVGEDRRIDFDRLRRTCRRENVRIIFLASPGNPLGRVWRREDMEKLADLAHEEQLYLIFDAVYKDIYFDRVPFNPLTLHSERLFFVDSFSKMLSITGWRIGYLVADREAMRRMRAFHDYIGLCAPSVLQRALGEYLEHHDFGSDYTRGIREKCRWSVRFLKRELEELGFRVPEVEGGYFIWAKIPPPYEDGYTFACRLFESVQVGVVPGENFTAGRNAYIRLNCAAERPVLEDAADRLRRFIRKS